MRRLAKIFARYIAAVIVAFVVSVIVLLLLIAAFVPSFKTAEWVLDVIVVAIGFAGVFAGSLCLERNNRRQGSIILLILGVLFYAYLTISVNYWNVNLAGQLKFVLWGMDALGLGGLGAVLLVFRLWPKDFEKA